VSEEASKTWVSEEAEYLFHTGMSLVYRVVAPYWMMDRNNGDDLKQAALFGLWKAANTYRPDKGKEFHYWAMKLMRHAIQDRLRQLDLLSRDNRTSVKQALVSSAELAQELGRSPTFSELEAHGIDTDSALLLMRLANPASIDEMLELHGHVSTGSALRAPGADVEVLDNDVSERLTAYVAQLRPQHSIVVELYYFQQLSQKEIGDVMGYSESRVCQLHRAAIKRLREIIETDDFA
jgi:RNA polymerase sigma factor FliA